MSKYEPKTAQLSLEDALVGHTVFLTGATGMLGTALLARLALETPIARIYALVRGNKDRLWERLGELLPEHMLYSLQACGKIVILGGDITEPNFGLTTETLNLLRRTVSIFIHSASSLHLKQPLSKISENVIHPSLSLGKLALECDNLHRFVYVSTAYANAFLHFLKSGQREKQECVIDERIYPLRQNGAKSSESELANIIDYGTTPEYSCLPHPFAYSYAKHLTERLLLERFSAKNKRNRLLIFRPSCFGPAESKPYPLFETTGSSPVTTVLAALLASPPVRMHFISDLPDPSLSNLDEVPVDIVVNRLIAHLAYGTSGCVHAVSGVRGRRYFEDMFSAATKLRSFWWSRPSLAWCGSDVDPSKQCSISRIFAVCGCSFLFREDKTEYIWSFMGEEDRQKWWLFTKRDSAYVGDFPERSFMARSTMHALLKKKYGVPAYAGDLMVKRHGERV